MAKKLTQEEVIKKFKEIHGDKYDYSKVQYVNEKTKVIVICPKKGHGQWKTTPNTHKRGRGCPECSGGVRYSLEKVIKNFQKVHGKKYDYSKVNYVNKSTDVIIICPKEGHGEFNQIPHNHLHGAGCPKCSLENKTSDLTNKRFGKLTVIRKVDENELKQKKIKKSGVYWLVKCACGREPFIVNGGKIRKGYSNSKAQWACYSCTRIEQGLKKRQIAIREIEGQTYNLLTVLKYWGSDKKQIMKVLCECRCGKQTITLSVSLFNGNTKSCGCLAEGGVGDSYEIFKSDNEKANSNCYFYLADIDNEHLKPGISSNLEQRKKGGKYLSYLFVSPLLTRSEAWTIEQIILVETIKAELLFIPEKFDSNSGVTEIRKKDAFSAYFYIDRFNNLLEELQEVGWEELYLSKFRKYIIN